VQGQKATEILTELKNKNKDETPQMDAYYKIIVESKLVLHEKK